MVSWPSTGWTNDRNVTQMLEILMMRGEVAISGRRGRQRVWDLAERVYPPIPRRPDTGGAPRQERASVAVARHRPGEDDRGPDRTVGCRSRGRAGHRRRRPRNVARGPRSARKALRGTYRIAVALRPLDPRSRPRAGSVRVRVRARDVQAEGAAALGLLRASRPSRRSAGGQAGRHSRPQGLEATCTRDPPGRSLHARDGAAVRAEVDALAEWLCLDGVSYE